jgi:hypothetical protein
MQTFIPDTNECTFDIVTSYAELKTHRTGKRNVQNRRQNWMFVCTVKTAAYPHKTFKHN